ncbi:MAG: Clp protease N-terminal domain-containing protein [Acidobacteriaceae bacterium]
MLFDRYTEKARRVIFFARYEASQFGSPTIDTEHLLLGLLREDKALSNRFFRSTAPVASIRKQIENHTTIRESISTSVDLPLSEQSKHVLKAAAEEAERLGHKHIGTEHLLLGLLHEEKSFAANILHERGLRLEDIRRQLSETSHAVPTLHAGTARPEMFRDLTQAASEGQLEQVMGRIVELEAMIDILCRRHQRNPILIGGPGAGKTSMVEALAQRIADGRVPSELADKRILACGPGLSAAWAKDWQRFDELTKRALGGANPSGVILLVDDAGNLANADSRLRASEGSAILRQALAHGETQCIVVVDSSGEDPSQSTPWLGSFSCGVHVRPLDEEATFKVLMARKSGLEKFHHVTFTQDALQFAAYSSENCLPGRWLPGKAIDLLDAAGSLVKARQTVPPAIDEAEARVRSATHRLETSIANHEFEKARFYSDEERKAREELDALRSQLHLDDSSSRVVNDSTLKEVISRWSAYPYRP